MGNVCSPGVHAENSPVADGAPAHDITGEVRLLMTAMDYKQTSNPLTCTIDADNMLELAHACGIHDITDMRDEQCTKEAVCDQIKEIAGRCGAGDVFVFYYSGHGMSVPDMDGDEADGKDEALCYVTRDGQVSRESCLIDDDFADVVTGALDKDTPMLILTDCCHSGTIADIRDAAWSGFQVVAIAGCADSQTSGDIGKGGIMTHSMMCAIQALAEEGEHEYSAATVYNKTLEMDNTIFASKQDISISTPAGCSPKSIPWPFIPSGSYEAPLYDAFS
jgi:hypothetical protein